MKQLNETMLRGIKLREGYDTDDEVITMLIREHMDRVRYMDLFNKLMEETDADRD